MKHELPLYGVINYFGDGWTIVYRYHPDNLEAHASHQGYGAFPSDRFNGVPVIDLQGVETLSCLTSTIEEYKDPPGYAIPLSAMLENCENAGARIFYN